MAFLDNTKKTRFKVTLMVIFYCMVIGAYSLYKDATDVTIIALGVVAASGVMYKHTETKRPSNK